MAFNFKDIQKGSVEMPRKIIIYGPPKLGKSTLVGSVKDGLLIPTEDRVAHIDCDKTPVVHSFQEILDIFDAVLTDGKQTYKRVVIDSLDWLEPILHQYVCDKKGFSSLTDDHNKETAFQKGLKYHAVEGWKMFLHNCDVLRENGIDVIFTAHSQTITINPPDTDSYDKSVMKIDKNSLSVIEEWADIIGFYNKKIYVSKEKSGMKETGKAKNANERILHLSGENPAFLNGNSFGLPDVSITLENCSDVMEYILTEKNN